ncbi:unnamed protein product [Polarella glacialis]|uniref:Uncharacterized protein n=1 Tax=Polarella glacialis TaxID=89957 RepID=A0A813FMT7_POLGL|nr:unnamed protein product [Polarella glacialis]
MCTSFKDINICSTSSTATAVAPLLVCLACGSYASADFPEFGRVGTWGVFAAGAASGAVVSTCLLGVAWRVRRSFEAPFDLRELTDSDSDQEASGKEATEATETTGQRGDLRSPGLLGRRGSSRKRPGASKFGVAPYTRVSFSNDKVPATGYGKATVRSSSPKAAAAAPSKARSIGLPELRSSAAAKSAAAASPAGAAQPAAAVKRAKGGGRSDGDDTEAGWDGGKWEELDAALGRDLEAAASLDKESCPSAGLRPGKGRQLGDFEPTDAPKPSRRPPRRTGEESEQRPEKKSSSAGSRSSAKG